MKLYVQQVGANALIAGRVNNPTQHNLLLSTINHGGRHIRVAEQFLHRADVVAVFKQVRRKAVA